MGGDEANETVTIPAMRFPGIRWMVHVRNKSAPTSTPIHFMQIFPFSAQPTIAHLDLEIGDVWDSAAVVALIRSKSTPRESPAFVFLGLHEAHLLRAHLGAAFGEDAVASLKDLYYMGLEVVEVEIDRFFRIAGRKTARASQAPGARRAIWRERTSDSLWSLRLG